MVPTFGSNPHLFSSKRLVSVLSSHLCFLTSTFLDETGVGGTTGYGADGLTAVVAEIDRLKDR